MENAKAAIAKGRGGLFVSGHCGNWELMPPCIRDLGLKGTLVYRPPNNPYVDEWEKNDIFPAHQVFKKFGQAGLLGISKPVEYGGMGLDYSYSMVMAEELGAINCGGVPMVIGVQTDMATPALARFGSDAVRKEFLAPSIAGDYVACLGVSEVGAGFYELSFCR